MGLSAPAIEWFRSYLQSRYQVVIIMLSQTNSSRLVECHKEALWVHSFSVSTPTIFRVFQNTALPTILNFNLQDQANAIAKLDEDLRRICNWTFRNQLLINPDKTSNS